MRKELREKGFTLVELAIVMVIIGLMLGAVLKGQSMIDNARQKRLVSDLQGITAAYYSYLDLYSAIPGDDTTANSRWSGVADGNGNVLIGGAEATPAGESLEAWQALRSARLISGDPAATGTAALPRHPYGGTMRIGDWGFGGTIGNANRVMVIGLSGTVASLIDLRLDDGVYDSGDIRGSAAYTTATVNMHYLL